MCPFGLPVSRGVLKVRSPTMKSSFPAGRAVQLRHLDLLCWEVSLEALPWSLQKIFGHAGISQEHLWVAESLPGERDQ